MHCLQLVPLRSVVRKQCISAAAGRGLPAALLVNVQRAKGLHYGLSNVVVVILFIVSWFMRPSNPAAPGMTAMMLGWIVRNSITQSASLEWTLMIARGPFPFILQSYAPDWSRTVCSSWKLIGLTR